MLVVYALAMFSTFAAIIVLATAFADRHKTMLLNDLRDLRTEALVCVSDEMESTAA